MFDSFQGDVLREYREWIGSSFRVPQVTGGARDFLLHVQAQAASGRYQGLWGHQREAVTRTIFASEVLRNRDQAWRDVLLNMATGTGKTAVIAALVAYFRCVHDVRSFLVLTPNTIVRERLSADFDGPSRVDSVWRRFGLFPPEFAHLVHDMSAYVLRPGAGSAGIRSASVVLANIHQLYDSSIRGQENLGVVVGQLGRVVVFNDEAHNTVAPRYDEVLDKLASSDKTFFRVDTTATPDRADGESPRSRMIYQYGIRDALRDRMVKSVFVCQPKIESVELTYTDTETGQIVRVEDVPWEEIDARNIPATKWVTSEKPIHQQLQMAVRRWEEQRERAQGRYKPILFVVAVSIRDAHNAREVLEKSFGLKTFVIASRDADGADVSAEQRELELKTAMVLGTPGDKDEYDAVVSILMLREGWDVRSVSVIALLRKFASPVYGQQVVGRGLRRVFPGDGSEPERLVVVDHPKLDHGWLWASMGAYVKSGVGQRQPVDLDEMPDVGSPQMEEPPVNDSAAGDVASGEGIELPDPAEFEDRPLEGDWRDYLRAIEYPREIVTISDVQKIGEVERDLTGTGSIREVPGGTESKDRPTAAIEGRSLEQRRVDVRDQIFDLTVEVLFNNGLPMSARSVIYGIILQHVSEKFLEGQTLGQATEARLRVVEDALHQVRPAFDRREVLRAMLRDPGDVA